MPLSDDACSQLLTSLKRALAVVDFDGGLRALDNIRWQELIPRTDTVSLENKWIAAEMYDYAGRYDEARHIIWRDAENLAGALDKRLAQRDSGTWMDDNDRHELKVKVSVVLQWGFTYYRQHREIDYARASELWTLCRDVVFRLLRTKNYPCHGTLARLHYATGLVPRQRHQYSEAKAAFADSIDSSWCDMAPRSQSETALAKYRLAKALAIGLGWICYTEGSLKMARPLIAVARALLAENDKEAIIKAYVDVIDAAARISAHGDDLDQVEKALETLHTSYRVFDERKHLAYRGRATNELALAYLRRSWLDSGRRDRDLQDAWDYAEKLKESSKGNKGRWYCNALIVQSRIHRYRKNHAGARDAAQDALDNAPDKFSRIDAHIALGEAQTGLADDKLGDCKDAVQNFHAAIQEGGENPKVLSVCRLHLARAYARMNRLADADDNLDKWRSVRAQAENAFVHGLARDVEREVEELKDDFTLRLKLENLDPTECEDNLHLWLIKWARCKAGPEATEDEVARILGVVKTTIRNWESKRRGPKSERARPASGSAAAS